MHLLTTSGANVNKPEKILYTAKVHTTGGRDGQSVSSDGLLEVKLALPKEMGGPGQATNPEQLFAAGYSACFLSALKHVAGDSKVTLPRETSIDASVSIGPIPQGFGLAVQMVIHLPAMGRSEAEDLVAAAHKVCPYSNATRGNIEVDLKVDTAAA
jgi:osmotically inducible protein OsmC